MKMLMGNSWNLAGQTYRFNAAAYKINIGGYGVSRFQLDKIREEKTLDAFA